MALWSQQPCAAAIQSRQKQANTPSGQLDHTVRQHCSNGQGYSREPDPSPGHIQTTRQIPALLLLPLPHSVPEAMVLTLPLHSCLYPLPAHPLLLVMEEPQGLHAGKPPVFHLLPASRRATILLVP